MDLVGIEPDYSLRRPGYGLLRVELEAELFGDEGSCAGRERSLARHEAREVSGVDSSIERERMICAA